jgi:hypothetical protein
MPRVRYPNRPHYVHPATDEAPLGWWNVKRSIDPLPIGEQPPPPFGLTPIDMLPPPGYAVGA